MKANAMITFIRKTLSMPYIYLAPAASTHFLRTKWHSIGVVVNIRPVAFIFPGPFS